MEKENLMSTKSGTLADLAKALSLAQAELGNAAKDSEGNFGKYASLGSLREAVNASLTRHGLSITQTFGTDPYGDFLETTLLHSSGEWVNGRLYLKLDKPSMQSLGSAISYARRYSLAAILNVTQEDDDDGQGAENHSQQKVRSESLPPLGTETTNRNTGLTKGKAPIDSNSSEYIINLGTLKNGSPHWLNGKTLPQADAEFNKATKQSRLRDAYEYQKNSKFRNASIKEFLLACDLFYVAKEAMALKNDRDPEPDSSWPDENIPF